jgi:hypothetical protein
VADTLLRFVNLLAWGALVFFALRALLLFVGFVVYPVSRLRLVDALNGVRRTFPWVQNFMYALIAAAWLFASHAL